MATTVGGTTSTMPERGAQLDQNRVGHALSRGLDSLLPLLLLALAVALFTELLSVDSFGIIVYPAIGALLYVIVVYTRLTWGRLARE